MILQIPDPCWLFPHSCVLFIVFYYVPWSVCLSSPPFAQDLQSFYGSYYPTLKGVPLSNVVGPNNAKGGIEAALDVEYMSTLGR